MDRYYSGEEQINIDFFRDGTAEIEATDSIKVHAWFWDPSPKNKSDLAHPIFFQYPNGFLHVKEPDEKWKVSFGRYFGLWKVFWTFLGSPF